MKKTLLTVPLDENEKQAILYGTSSEAKTEDYMNGYIDSFIQKNDLKGYELPKKGKIRLLASVVLSVVYVITILYHMFYHKSLFLIYAPATVAYFIVLFKTNSLKSCLLNEVIKRPDDSIDNILSSQVSGAGRNLASKIVSAVIILASLIITCSFFTKPIVVYEKNDMGGYSVRYYTLSVGGNEKHIELPETHNGLPVNEIRGGVFCNMSFETITLPSGITEIRGNTFEGCDQLRSIVIPEGVTRIGGHAFRDCSSLSRVELPESLESIGSSAFRACNNLRKIRIPEKTSINERAFKESPTEITRF